jgi:hypothetical protein
MGNNQRWRTNLSKILDFSKISSTFLLLELIHSGGVNKKSKMAAKNQNGVKWTFLNLKIDWKANYQSIFKLFWLQLAKFWVLA